MRLQCMGSAICRINEGEHTTRQKVYFIPTAKQLFLSLGTLKENIDKLEIWLRQLFSSKAYDTERKP